MGVFLPRFSPTRLRLEAIEHHVRNHCCGHLPATAFPSATRQASSAGGFGHTAKASLIEATHTAQRDTLAQAHKQGIAHALRSLEHLHRQWSHQTQPTLAASCAQSVCRIQALPAGKKMLHKTQHQPQL